MSTTSPSYRGCRYCHLNEDRELLVGRLASMALRSLPALVALLPSIGLARVPARAEPVPPAPAAQGGPPSVVLLTLDTTRADHVGSARTSTPVLDALAASGVRYLSALTPSPLTLPAHASIMTGLDPPGHGVRDNGITPLATEVSTLAEALSKRSFTTGAFVSSRVLDHRFGLDRGFDLYDDRMTAERVGEYGYPERDAAAVTSAAVAWLDSIPDQRPFFLWVHYYDPHAPYDPPGALPSDPVDRRYAGEIAFVDSEIGRLLRALPAQSRGRVVAVVGDHGESLGEHKESTHGIFLYGASLDVPLIIAGRGVPQGRVLESIVGTRRLPATLLELIEHSESTSNLPRSAIPGPVLPGIFAPADRIEPEPVYSETRFPTTAYGWAPLQSISTDRWRLIDAPRVELYDLVADPAERRNLAADEPEEARRLLSRLRQLEHAMPRRETPPAPRAPDLEAALRGLGYLDSGGTGGSIDPKDGVRWLEEFEQAQKLMANGHRLPARALLETLVARNPENVPFLTNLAGAQIETGAFEAALANYQRAVELTPRLEFTHLNLARAYARLGRTDDARRAYEAVLALNPRSSVAWLALAETAFENGRRDRELALLERAVEAGTTSAVVHNRLGQISAERPDFAAALAHFDRAIELIPGWPSPWLAGAACAERSQQWDVALERYRRAAELTPSNPAPLLGQARVHRALGEPAEARRLLEQLLMLAPNSSEATAARELLAALRSPG